MRPENLESSKTSTRVSNATMGCLLCVALAFHIAAPLGRSQELEPRSLTNVPVGMNFVLVGYGYARGNILLDPSVPIEDLDAKLHTLVGAYVRSINLLGLASKFDVIVPFAAGDWKGLLEGQDTARSATGFGDPRVRLSMNFVGAPALKGAEFAGYRQKTIVGASLQVVVPVGQYDPTKLLNLGSNRWIFRPQIGVSRVAGPWILEAYAAGWFFTKNTDFFGGSTLRQRPLLAAKLHFIRSFPKGRWIALDGGYGIGGRTILDGEAKETHISTFRFGLTLAAPIATRHTARLVLTAAVRGERGPDYNGISIFYQYRWGGMPK